MMSARMGMPSPMSQPCRCGGAEATQRKGQNENPARNPGAGSQGFTTMAAHRSGGPRDYVP